MEGMETERAHKRDEQRCVLTVSTHLTAARVQKGKHFIYGPAALRLNARGIES